MPMPTLVMHEGARRFLEEVMCSGDNNKGSHPSPRKRRSLQGPPSSPIQESSAASSTPDSNHSDGQDLISSLPDECIYLIFTHLSSPRDRCCCAAVSRKWLLLQAHMRPSDFRSISGTTTPSSLQQKSNDDIAQREEAVASRCLHSQKATDARLAAMAVGACARGAPTELVIRATHVDPAPKSSLLIISDMGLNIICQACPKLKSFILWNCSQVGNEGLASIARHCPSLEKLDISKAPLVDDGGLIPIALNCPKLSELRLETCPGVGDGTLQTFANFSSNLESITLENCPLAGETGLVAVFSSLLRLASVKLADMKVGDRALQDIGDRGQGNSTVRSVCLHKVTGLTHVGFRRLGLATTLRSLTVSCCAGFNDSCLDPGGSGALSDAIFVGLRNVTVKSCGSFTDRGLLQLSETAKQLESLQLEKCHGITTMGLMGAVGKWSASLRLLSLVKCSGIGTIVQQQKQRAVLVPCRCPLLQSLSIKRCPRVGDEFLSLMGTSLVRARRIAVVGMGSVTDRGFISMLASMERRNGLQRVDLSGCPGITDGSVAALVSACGEALKSLTLEGCEGVTDRSLRMIGLLCRRLVELDLSGCRQISDGGVAGLLASCGPDVRVLDQQEGSTSGGISRKSRLEVLSLEGCGGITDESLRRLEEMVVRGSLAGLNLKHCGGLSRAGIDSVRQTLWWCDLIY